MENIITENPGTVKNALAVSNTTPLNQQPSATPCDQVYVVRMVKQWSKENVSVEDMRQRLRDAKCADVLIGNFVSAPASTPVSSKGIVQAENRIQINPSARSFFLDLDQWAKVDLDTPDNAVLVGTPQNAIIRPGTKNLIVAPEKAYKTTTLLRLALGMAYGHTVYPSLPVARPVKVLYLHGELIPMELKERTLAAKAGIPPELVSLHKGNFIQGRSIDAHLITAKGQSEVRAWVKHFKPDVLVIDPWQSFISGYDENSFEHTSQATNFLDQLSVEQGGLTIFMPVHTGKDQSKGARGHSSLAGWRDTLIRLIPVPKDDKSIKVQIRPRWGQPLALNLKFQSNTMVEGDAFSPQSTKIRNFLIEEKAKNHKLLIKREEVEVFLGGKKDAAQKAIRRAIEEKAIGEIGNGATKGELFPVLDENEAFGE